MKVDLKCPSTLALETHPSLYAIAGNDDSSSITYIKLIRPILQLRDLYSKTNAQQLKPSTVFYYPAF